MKDLITRVEIEARGFSHTGKSIDDWYQREGEFDMGSWTSYKMTMQYGSDSRMRIFVDDRGEEVDVFKGVVQSVEQFDSLLEMICIE